MTGSLAETGLARGSPHLEEGPEAFTPRARFAAIVVHSPCWDEKTVRCGVLKIGA